MRKSFLTALAMAAAVTQSAPAHAIEDFTPFVRSSIETYIRPAFSAFADTTSRLPDAVEAVCDHPTPQSQALFASLYGDVVASFGGISFLRFGPLIDDHRLDSLAFMPDPRGIAQRQIRKTFASDDTSFTDPKKLREKSVALQGLTALQLIAFDGNGVVTLGNADTPQGDVCGYALAISKNVAAIASTTNAEWQDPSGYSDELLNPRSNSQIRTPKEAIETIFNALVTGLIVIKDQELLPTLGTDIKKARGTRFPFSRSQNGRRYVMAELNGIQNALNAARFGDVLGDDFKWIPQSLSFEFDNGQSWLASIDQPIRQSIKDPGVYGKLGLLTITINSLRDTMALELAGALGLSGGFNALDGD
ncbi:imelysin family protein [Roseibium sp.]|uniref:imelysin family protein n=1 Tax=Roseibium sp. TaxID=1936156 RepID=UPI003A97D336